MARPTEYTAEIAATICEQLAAGNSIRMICAKADMPSERSIYRWLAAESHEEFRQQYARAREAQAHRMLDEILEIADDSGRDVVEIVVSVDEEGNEKTREVERFTATARDKLRIDTRKWAMARLAPKVYGDSKQLDVTSGGQRVTGFAIVDYTADDSAA